jgi:hypothetical protein
MDRQQVVMLNECNVSCYTGDFTHAVPVTMLRIKTFRGKYLDGDRQTETIGSASFRKVNHALPSGS